MTIQWSLLLSGTLLAIGAADATPSAWRATAHYTLGGEGGWDLAAFAYRGDGLFADLVMSSG